MIQFVLIIIQKQLLYYDKSVLYIYIYIYMNVGVEFTLT